MLDPISLGVGAVIFIGGFLAGRWRRPAKEAPAGSVCGCTHPLAYHDPKTNACNGEIKQRKYNGSGESEWVPCPCRRYTGPPPLENFLMPPFLPPVDHKEG